MQTGITALPASAPSMLRQNRLEHPEQRTSGPRRGSHRGVGRREAAVGPWIKRTGEDTWANRKHQFVVVSADAMLADLLGEM